MCRKKWGLTDNEIEMCDCGDIRQCHVPALLLLLLLLSFIMPYKAA